MSLRSEFLALARSPSANVSQLCLRFGVSRKTGYKWLARDAAGPEVADRSRRPLNSPRLTPPGLQAHVLAVRQRYPFYGGRKIRHILLREGIDNPPSPSTITAILDRNGLLSPERRRLRDWQRFEAAAPNALWQMDFKGHFPLSQGGRCHPLTVLDDHSRFCICLAACPDEQGTTTRDRLCLAFQRYGLPESMLMDNGSPFGASGQGLHTAFSASLIRLGITVLHGRPYHPQTQGKEERFHRTLKLEVLSQRPVWHDQLEAQAAFDRWRSGYNLERPHEALGFEVPASRYAPSPRPYPSVLPPIEYEVDFQVRRVQDNGRVKLKGQRFFVGHAFRGEPVGLLQVGDSVWDVYYCHQRIARIDLAQPPANPVEV
jgi:transposase InsO family protein